MRAFFTLNPAGNEKRICESPEEGDHHSADRQRQDVLCHGGAGALEIDIMRAGAASFRRIAALKSGISID